MFWRMAIFISQRDDSHQNAFLIIKKQMENEKVGSKNM